MAEEVPTRLYEVRVSVVVRVREESEEAAKEAVASGWQQHGLPHCQSVRQVAVWGVREVRGT